MVLEKVYILLGSNLGNREKLMCEACVLISERCGKILMKSPVYESEPWGFDAEQWFLNQVVEIETSLSADDLMRELLSRELSLGRDRVTPHEGFVSRPIDLDILYYGNHIIDTDLVTAPHPRLHLRRFTLLPLCDIAPDFVNLRLNMSNTQLLESCDDKGIVNRY